MESITTANKTSVNEVEFNEKFQEIRSQNPLNVEDVESEDVQLSQTFQKVLDEDVKSHKSPDDGVRCEKPLDKQIQINKLLNEDIESHKPLNEDIRFHIPLHDVQIRKPSNDKPLIGQEPSIAKEHKESPELFEKVRVRSLCLPSPVIPIVILSDTDHSNTSKFPTEFIPEKSQSPIVSYIAEHNSEDVHNSVTGAPNIKPEKGIVVDVEGDPYAQNETILKKEPSSNTKLTINVDTVIASVTEAEDVKSVPETEDKVMKSVPEAEDSVTPQSPLTPVQLFPPTIESKSDPPTPKTFRSNLTFVLKRHAEELVKTNDFKVHAEENETTNISVVEQTLKMDLQSNVEFSRPEKIVDGRSRSSSVEVIDSLSVKTTETSSLPREASSNDILHGTSNELDSEYQNQKQVELRNEIQNLQEMPSTEALSEENCAADYAGDGSSEDRSSKVPPSKPKRTGSGTSVVGKERRQSKVDELKSAMKAEFDKLSLRSSRKRDSGRLPSKSESAVQSADDTTIIHQGFLFMKKKGPFSQWKKYYFILKSENLSSYRTQDDFEMQVMKDSFDLRNVEKVMAKKPSLLSKYWPLVLTRNSPLGTINLASLDHEDRDTWLHILEEVIPGLMSRSLLKPTRSISTDVLAGSRNDLVEIEDEESQKKVTATPPPEKALSGDVEERETATHVEEKVHFIQPKKVPRYSYNMAAGADLSMVKLKVVKKLPPSDESLEVDDEITAGFKSIQENSSEELLQLKLLKAVSHETVLEDKRDTPATKVQTNSLNRMKKQAIIPLTSGKLMAKQGDDIIPSPSSSRKETPTKTNCPSPKIPLSKTITTFMTKSATLSEDIPLEHKSLTPGLTRDQQKQIDIDNRRSMIEEQIQHAEEIQFSEVESFDLSETIIQENPISPSEDIMNDADSDSEVALKETETDERLSNNDNEVSPNVNIIMMEDSQDETQWKESFTIKTDGIHSDQLVEESSKKNTETVEHRNVDETFTLVKNVLHTNIETVDDNPERGRTGSCRSASAEHPVANLNEKMTGSPRFHMFKIKKHQKEHIEQPAETAKERDEVGTPGKDKKKPGLLSKLRRVMSFSDTSPFSQKDTSLCAPQIEVTSAQQKINETSDDQYKTSEEDDFVVVEKTSADFEKESDRISFERGTPVRVMGEDFVKSVLLHENLVDKQNGNNGESSDFNHCSEHVSSSNSSDFEMPPTLTPKMRIRNNSPAYDVPQCNLPIHVLAEEDSERNVSLTSERLHVGITEAQIESLLKAREQTTVERDLMVDNANKTELNISYREDKQPESGRPSNISSFRSSSSDEPLPKTRFLEVENRSSSGSGSIQEASGCKESKSKQENKMTDLSETEHTTQLVESNRQSLTSPEYTVVEEDGTFSLETIKFDDGKERRTLEQNMDKLHCVETQDESEDYFPLSVNQKTPKEFTCVDNSGLRVSGIIELKDYLAQHGDKDTQESKGIVSRLGHSAAVEKLKELKDQ